jgi:amidohydrolase
VTQLHLVGETGALVRVGGPGPSVCLRGELDALPIQEQSKLPYASANEGVMHACGHDVHLAALVAVTTAIAGTAGTTPAVAVLQPREETYPSGAKDIADSGFLQKHDPVAMIGAHLHPSIAPGAVACTPGAVNASSDEFALTVTGRSGHAAYPHEVNDPVLALCQIVVTAQSIVSRMSDPMSNTVLSVTMLQAGSAPNAIPATAHARGSIRAMRSDDRKRVIAQLAHVATQVAAAHGCRAELDVTAGEPVLNNDPGVTAACAALLHDNGAVVIDSHRSAGSDDFAYFCDMMPSLMMFVGAATEDSPLHSPTFAPPDSAVADVARALMCGYLAALTIHESTTCRMELAQ